MKSSIFVGAVAALALAGCASGGGPLGSGDSKKDEGGSWLERTASVGCTNPLIDTYKCFEGTLISNMVGGPDAPATAEIAPQPAPSFAERPPRTLSFSGRLQANGERASAPFPVASQVIEAPALEAYVEEILGRLLQHSPTPPPSDISVHVIADPLFGGVATAENDIFVNLGAFAEAPNEGVVAALLAHEASHILLEHFDREELIEKQQQVTGAVAKTAILAAGLSSQRFGTNTSGQSGFYTDPEAAERAKRTQTTATVVNAGANFISTDVIGGAWSRRQEDEADILGADLLVAAGYDARRSLMALDILRAAYSERETELERLSVDTTAMQTALTEDRSAEGLIGGMTDALSQVFTAAWNDVRSWTQRSHLDPTKRRESMTGYVRREYRQAKPTVDRKAEAESLKRVKRQARFGRLLERYKKVEAARRIVTSPAEGQAPDYARAEAILRDGMGGSVAQDAYPRELLATILAAQGKKREALASYDRVRPGSVLSINGYTEKFGLEMELGQQSSARRTLATAQEVYGQPLFYNLELRALAAEGDAEGVKRVAAACRESEYPGVEESCDEVLASIPESLGGDQGKESGGFLESVSGALSGGSIAQTDENETAAAATPASATSSGSSSSSGGILGGIESLLGN
ncbi:MAG: M48 family metalloprotease [Pseudomonadota bacterium]